MPKPVYISGIGIICSLGLGPAEIEQGLRQNRSAIRPLELFDLLHGEPLPVGQADCPDGTSALPRTHRLARIAASQAMAGKTEPPEAIVLGTTTGGILITEQLLRKDERRKEEYRYHGLQSVSDSLAEELNCTGPALTVSTACSSGVVALATGLALLRSGRARTVLVGGVDSLSRLTYFGFHSLQLVDRNGCKPLDLNRQGMAVAEGAGMLLLTTDPEAASHGEILGAGLSCDAYHPAAPHPEGEGAFMAMQRALFDAGLSPEDIDYINLHGTGTPDNDLAESRAINRLFPNGHPPLSSIKGATGHSLAAAGAIETVVATICASADLLPANTRLQQPDPALKITPLLEPKKQPVEVVLTNSFGFGGNNGSVVLGQVRSKTASSPEPAPTSTGFGIHGYCCLSGAGDTAATLERLKSEESVAGRASQEAISNNLPPRLVRRLKRLPRMALSLGTAACEQAKRDGSTVNSVYMGTGWGALSETHDFLTRLNDSQEQFPSPTDFVGSVHNAPASQVAMMFKATGANITTSGGDYSFEQALLAAELMETGGQEPQTDALLLGADEGHDSFSPLFDPSIAPESPLADGGAAFCINRETAGAKCCITIPFYQRSSTGKVMELLLESLDCFNSDTRKITAILAGMPAAMRDQAERQLKRFLQLSGLTAPVIDYRRITGEFASATAVATALAASFLEDGRIPGSLVDGTDIVMEQGNSSILVLGLGSCITAMELFRP